MIKSIVRKSYTPVQAIFYSLQRRKYANKMMSYYLKIKPKKACATSRICEVCLHGK